MSYANIRLLFLGGCLAAILSGCGSSDSSGGTGGTGVTASTVTTGTVTAYGSIVVNGIHFDETNALVSINDASGSGDHQGIKIGMTVKIRGTSNGSTGVATDIEAEHAVEGKVTSKSGTDTLVVLGQTILVDAQTLYEPMGTTYASLAVGTQVEVYGLRDENNTIRATLIEVEDNNEFEEELRGTIANLDTGAMTFELNGVVVHYDNTTTFTDGGSIAGLANGLTVEAHFDTDNSGFHATEIEFEDNEDSEYEVGDGSEVTIEAYVTNVINATTFEVGSQVVQTTSNTIYDGGVAGDIAIGIKVEVEGTISGGVLIASKVRF